MGEVTKSAIRKSLLTKKQEISDNEYLTSSTLIEEKLKSLLEELNPQVIHSYLPIKRNREPDTFPIINWLLKKNRKILISKTDFENKSMSHFDFNQTTELAINKWGIPEPTNAKPEVLNAELFLVPLVAMDLNGNRLGYGGGYYDRLLVNQTDSIKVGLSLLPIQNEFRFVEPHDIKLDFGVTPNEILRC